jgi:hypothetical protein
VKPPRLRGVRSVPQLCVLYPGIWLTSEDKSTGKTPVRLVEMRLLGTVHYVDMAIFRQVVPTSLSIPVSLGMLARPGSTLGIG